MCGQSKTDIRLLVTKVSKEGRKCWLYGIGHMVEDHSDSERRNPLLPLHGLFFFISSKGFLTDRIAHIMTFVTPVVDYRLELEKAKHILAFI